jgi:hypothetical protein
MTGRREDDLVAVIRAAIRDLEEECRLLGEATAGEGRVTAAGVRIREVAERLTRALDVVPPLDRINDWQRSGGACVLCDCSLGRTGWRPFGPGRVRDDSGREFLLRACVPDCDPVRVRLAALVPRPER